jgi:D-alanyl-D-alanine carboxypeptidase/D-alanyl-D-alanine-endopeptidase (penicillin-binding protein 4)
MRKYSTVMLFALTVSGCAGFFPARTEDSLRSLRSTIDRTLADSLFIPTMAAVKVVSLETGETLYSRNSKLLFRPASNTKLFTSAAALHVLGTSFSFRTLLSTDSLDETGTTCSNLYMKGYGDPDLTAADIDSLAARLAQNGLRTVTRDIVADATYFDAEYWAPGWMWDDEPDPDGAPISSLSVNKNCIRIITWPDSLTRSMVQVRTEPLTSYLQILNCAVVSDDSLMPRLNVHRLFRERNNTINIDGRMRTNDRPRSTRTTVWQPELYAATLLKEACERHGIVVNGIVRFGALPPDARMLAEHQQPIDSMVINLNKVSDNLSAENTLKTLSAVTFGGRGTTASGLYVVNSVLSSFGIDTTKHRFVDGSGISHYNLVSVETIVQLLVGMHQRADLFPLYYESLPIAGRDGTISRRMVGTPAEGILRAKTGTISGVSALSGYVQTRDGELLAFSMMMQNFINSADRYREIQDRIGAILAGFSRTIPFTSH